MVAYKKYIFFIIMVFIMILFFIAEDKDFMFLISNLFHYNQRMWYTISTLRKSM